MKKSTIGRVLQWGIALIVASGLAVGIAAFFTNISEKKFQEKLQAAPVNELVEMTKSHPYEPSVFYTLGLKLLEQDKNKEAALALERSATMNPKYAPAKAALGLALARIDRPLDAEAQLKKAIALDPKLQIAYFSLGSLYGKYSRFVQAKETLIKAVELNPKDIEAKYLLAIAYGNVYQDDRKLEMLEQVIKEEPNNVRYLKSLGYSYLFFGKFQQAEANYRHILTLEPDDNETHYLLGRSLAEEASTPQQFADSEKELTAVALKEPKNASVHLGLGILFARQNHNAKAIPELESAIKLGITEQKTWLYLGQSYAKAGKMEESKRTLSLFQAKAEYKRETTQMENRLMNIPDEVDTRLKLAKLYLSHKDYPHAKTHLSSLLEKDKSSSEATVLMAECLKNAPSAGAN